MMQQRINPTSRLTMRVNATDLFERYMYDELYDDVIEPSLPTLEITEISFAQTIEGVYLMSIIFSWNLFGSEIDFTKKQILGTGK